jgi:hypothetical protein
VSLIRQTLPAVLAIIIGGLALIGLLFAPMLAELLTGWAAFLSAIALILGIGNLVAVHGRRLRQANVHSATLLLAMVAVFALAIADDLGVTEQGVNTLFEWVLRPLEAALASLLAFFLLFAGYRLLRRQPGGWSLLFLLAALFFLVLSLPLPGVLGDVAGATQRFVRPLIVDSGVRALLIGVALGTLTLGLRVLTGLERPYSQ